MSRLKKWLGTHRYAAVLLYLPVYLLYFGYLQLRAPALAAAGRVHMLSFAVDQMIPTVPGFFLPYASWWLLFPGAIAFFLFLGSREDFLKLCFLIFAGYTLCLVAYTLYPNGLDLRQPLPGQDLCSMGIRWLRSIDPPVNVCPSMHVSSTLSIEYTVRESRNPWLTRRVKGAVSLLCFLICVSTLLIRQHSVLDVVLAAGMTLLLRYGWGKWRSASEKYTPDPEKAL